ncbi:MAG: VCBS repeat-containing protein [Balneolaceae bacterium]|nr:VCBS repeat-containing protein [Balneolaceae bacterium]
MNDYYSTFFAIIVLVAAAGGVFSCSSKPDLQDGTPAMVTRLDSISNNIDIRVNEYANNARLEHFMQFRTPFELVPKLNYHLTLAQEQLRAGQTEKAIERYQHLIKVWNGLEPAQKESSMEFRRSVEESLALSYLRLGEQQNCLLNHSAASCLFPIKGDGVHTITEGSEKAIEIYKRLIPQYEAENNEDMALTSQWLLNIAYMTLGRHPQDVPDQWLIPEKAFKSEYDLPTFTDIAMTVGLAEQGLSGGSITEDFNNDGYIDVVASSWGLDDQLHYFENTGQGTFIKKTNEAELTGIVGGLNLRHADFNNDGFADILVLRGAWIQSAGHHPNSLLLNNGDGTFSDVTKSAGLFSLHPTQTAEWGDFNNDGWLDLFIGNETNGSDVNPCELFLNQGDGTFEEVAASAGVDVTGYVKGVAIGDFNNDGWQDLYVSRYDGPNVLFKNEQSSSSDIPTFTDVTQKAGVAQPEISFPTWFWDYNNDGWQDLFVSAYDAIPSDVAREYLGKKINGGIPRLYKNNGDGTFTDVTAETNLKK